LIEHSHRLAGYTVGACVIVLVLALWCTERRRWVRWLGIAALAGVLLQGVLGGLRVLLNARYGPELALIHGCFGQMVFALLATLAVCTSRRWEKGTFVFSFGVSQAAAETTRRWSLIVVGLLLLQLIAGAGLRHLGSTLGQRGHLLGAFAVVAAVVWLARTVYPQRTGSVSDRSESASDRGLERSLRVLGILLGLQLMLGVEAWLTKFAVPAYTVAAPQPFGRDLVRSAHVLIGALVLAAGVAVALEAHRRAWAIGQAAAAPANLAPEREAANLPEAAERQVGDLPHEKEAVAAARLEGAL
jgi:cytochrome c oxidase assembly protein subunit 15